MCTQTTDVVGELNRAQFDRHYAAFQARAGDADLARFVDQAVYRIGTYAQHAGTGLGLDQRCGELVGDGVLGKDRSVFIYQCFGSDCRGLRRGAARVL